VIVTGISGSLRGAGFAPALAAQRAYLEQEGAPTKFGLIVPEAFVRGIRDLGYRSNGDALAELIDNALQAYADRVDVLFGFEGGSLKKPSQVAVLDNGHGMDPGMIRMAVMWGGTHRENDRSGLGRYGYGLPCASVSLGRRFTVYSAVDNGRVHAVTVDLDRLTSGDYTDRSGEIIVPPAEPAELPAFVADAVRAAYPDGWKSGTVILIEKLDRLEWTTAQGLRDNLCRQFGVTYHKLRGDAELYVDGQYVEPIDPLFITPGFRFHDTDQDRAVPLDPVRIEARSPDDGAYLGAVTLRYAWLPPSFGSADKARDAVGVNANDRFPIMKDYHGVIFSRNGRLIDVQTRTPWTSFINNDRYIKVEVEFSATLDEAFGVTTSKQQVTVSPFAWDLLLQAGLPKAIEQLRTKVKDAKLDRRARALSPAPGEHCLSERAMGVPPPVEGEQGSLNLRPPRYRTMLERRPDDPFFQIDQTSSGRTLRLNTAHRFFTDIYDAPTATPELRAALEVLLFAFGDAVLANPGPNGGPAAEQLFPWSRRLNQALEMLASHLLSGEEEDVGAGAWDDAG
jgi:Histidine kinase-, DNA gyrase B-, and HSP90-like ATPase